MQISPISAFKAVNFKGSSPHTNPETGVSYDAGQPYRAAETKDVFVKRDKKGDAPKADREASKAPEYSSIEEAMEAGAPGFRPEDFRY